MQMSREKELVKNTFVLSLGKFLPKLASFITLPILTACLTKAEYGTYDLISTLVMMVIPIATLQIQSAAFRFLIDCRGDKERSSEIISNIFVVTIPISIIASIFIQFFFPGLDMAIRIMISLYLFLDTVHLAVAQITRGLGNNRAYSLAAIFVSATTVPILVILIYKLQTGLLGVTISLVVSQLVGTLYLIKKTNLFTYIDPSKVSGRQIKDMLAYSWPMVPNNLSTWVLKLSDRLVITGFLGVEANAVYAVANKIPNMLSIAQSIMVMAWQENASIAAKDTDADKYYTKMLDRTFNLMFGCTALLIAATPILFRLLVRGDYAQAYYQMPVLILAMFFFVMSSYFGGIYIAHKKTVNVGVSTMVAAVINLAIDLAFVNIIGIWAGSVSTLTAYFVLYVYRMLNCQKFQKVEVNYKKQIVQIAIMILLLISCFMQKTVLNCVNIVLAIILFWAFNREIVEAAFASLLKIARKRRG